MIIYEIKNMFIQYLIASQNDLRKCTYMYSTTLKTYPTVYNNQFFYILGRLICKTLLHNNVTNINNVNTKDLFQKH